MTFQVGLTERSTAKPPNVLELGTSTTSNVAIEC
jgi:hypothetical protein